MPNTVLRSAEPHESDEEYRLSPPPRGELLNAFTVDVEDYFHVSAFESDVTRSQWDQYECRVVANTHRILRLLDRRQIAATFFLLGWVARRYPRLVRDIHRAGHEIGSHSYWHRLIYQQTPDEFRSDLRQSRAAIEDVIGQRVTAHRAPSFSVTRRSLWALDVLSEEGFLADSSVFPAHHDRYGIPNAETGIHRVVTAAGPLWEIPMTVAQWAGMRFPVGGGGYFRLYPLCLTLCLLARINRRYRRPFVCYVHPWELDPQQPRLRPASRVSRFRHYVNLAATESRLAVLLSKFRFGRLDEVIRQWQSRTDRPQFAGEAVS